MLKSVPMLLLLFLLGNAAAYAQPFSEPVDYLDHVAKEADQIKLQAWEYTDLVSHGRSARKAEEARQKLLQAIGDTRSRLLRLATYDGETEVRDSIVSFLRICYYSLKDDYGDILDMEAQAQASPDRLDAYIHAIQNTNDKINRASEGIEKAFDSFGKKYDVEITHNPDALTLKLTEANKVTDHYNLHNVFLWRCNFQDEMMNDAMEKEDIAQMQKVLKTLDGLVKEGRSRMGEFAHYKGDKSFGDATEALINFYAREVKSEYPFAIRFFRTAKELDENPSPTNEAIDAFNKMVGEFNSRTQALYEERVALVNAWNESADRFRDRHTPR